MINEVYEGKIEGETGEGSREIRNEGIKGEIGVDERKLNTRKEKEEPDKKKSEAL